MEMTPRQRWMAIFNGQKPDRVPTDYWATAEFDAKLKKHLGCATDEELWRKFHIDRPKHVCPTCKLVSHPNDPQADLWGLRHRQVNYGTGEYREVERGPLAWMTSVKEVEAFRWPGIHDHDYGTVTQAAENDDRYRAICGGSFEPFLLYCAMRGMEQAYEDLILNPEIAEAGLNGIFEFYYPHMEKVFQAGKGKIDYFYLAEDLGGQTGPLMSLETYRKFLLPNQKKMAELARRYGVHVFYHTDGAARIFLPDLIDVVGIEVLNPLQWRCPGMERESLVRDFGKRIAFHGGMDNQKTLPFCSRAEVAREVRENARIFGNSRWICAPCHNIQNVTPVENVVAMYEEIRACGKIG